MPVADGWAATKGMRELDAARAMSGSEQQLQVPVVVCTASCLDDLVEGGETVAQRALTLGANGAVRKPLTTKAVLALLDEYAPRWRAAMEQQQQLQQHAAIGGSSPISPDASGKAPVPVIFPVAARADAFVVPHGRGTHAEHHSWSGMPAHHNAPHHHHHQSHAPASRQQRSAECRCTSVSGVCCAGVCLCGGAPRPAPAAAAPPPAGAGRRFLQLGGSGGPLDGRTLRFCTSHDLGAGASSAASHRQQARQYAQQLLLKRCGRSHRDLSRARPDCLDGDSAAAAASAHAQATASAQQRRMSFDVAAMSWMMAARRSTSPGYSRPTGVAPPANVVVTAAALG
ncbi:hypothetical protein HXX76_007754 [Chlamydomonas incerta]|uniref:Response regulatory domain-containing protein n=1 Tax=Chlamydomonas incerta TaxID=51695 RepID=A0A835T7T7_CHLIN|nr:hypothetical protein HXX76_007754 [Chlamydomonas incerta]|eukprot:KAG2434025.1 hypothetical protein HXX76_007754 [Chlamydomonas incerta]